MPRRKAISSEPKQQTLIRFLPPSHSKNSSVRNDGSRTKPGPSRLATGVSKGVSSKHDLIELSDHSDTNNGVDKIHFEPKKAAISDDDDIQLSSPIRRRKTVAVVRSRNLNRFPSVGGWPESDPQAQRRLTIFSARSTKQVIVPSSHAVQQLISLLDIIQSRFRDRRKRSAFQTKLDQLKSEHE